MSALESSQETRGSSQVDELLQRFEAHIAETESKHIDHESAHVLCISVIEAQDERISKLESSQKQLDLEQTAQSASCTREIEGLSARIDISSQNDEVLNNDMRKLTQRFEATSAELDVRFQNSETWRAEVISVCQKNNEWCSQLEELTKRLETQIAEHNQYFELHHTVAAPVNFETVRDQFESRLASESKKCQELIEARVEAHASELQDLRATLDTRIQDLMSHLDAEKEKQEEQNQAAFSCMTFTTALVGEIRSLVETECVQIGQALNRGSTELCRQLEDLESRLKVDIETNASTIQEHKTQLEVFSSMWGSNSAR